MPTSIKGNNSVTNMQKMTPYNHNLDLINVNVHANLVQFSPFILKDIEWKQYFDINQGP